MKNNTFTIVRKECRRFFGDRALFFTAVIMPGLLIYLIYTLMGSYMPDFKAEEPEYVNMLTAEEQVLFDSLSAKAFVMVDSGEEPMSEEPVSEEQEVGNVLAALIPMLIIMLLFSGCMAVAPASIAGEKERGTIATLLVTPLNRSELALGKIISLSFFAILSGCSSFLGIILSLPKMLHADELGLGDLYAFSDYLLLLLLIVSTTLVIVSLISILSALAKSVKTASTMVTPLMLVVMLVGLSPMLMGDKEVSLAGYLVPLFNSAQSMAGVFSFQVDSLSIVVTVGVNLCFTALAIWVLTRMFNSERVMFSK